MPDKYTLQNKRPLFSEAEIVTAAASIATAAAAMDIAESSYISASEITSVRRIMERDYLERRDEKTRFKQENYAMNEIGGYFNEAKLSSTQEKFFLTYINLIQAQLIYRRAFQYVDSFQFKSQLMDLYDKIVILSQSLFSNNDAINKIKEVLVLEIQISKKFATSSNEFLENNQKVKSLEQIAITKLPKDKTSNLLAKYDAQISSENKYIETLNPLWNEAKNHLYILNLFTENQASLLTKPDMNLLGNIKQETESQERISFSKLTNMMMTLNNEILQSQNCIQEIEKTKQNIKDKIQRQITSIHYKMISIAMESYYAENPFEKVQNRLFDLLKEGELVKYGHEYGTYRLKQSIISFDPMGIQLDGITGNHDVDINDIKEKYGIDTLKKSISNNFDHEVFENPEQIQQKVNHLEL